MKKQILVFIFLCAGAFMGNVVFASDIGNKKASKNEVSFSIDKNDVSVNAQDALLFHYSGFATNVDPILIPKGSITYLDIKKAIYNDPKVDTKWVWWYSTAYNV